MPKAKTNINYIDKERFDSSRLRVLSEDTLESGIGTLGEKALHKTVKYYLEPDDSFHEIEHLGYVADIMRDGIITEVQTGGFLPLVSKLSRFLKEDPVILVHPLVARKRIRKWDEEKGEFSPSKMSPRRKSHFDLGYELFKISDFLLNERFKVRILYLECEEYKKDRARHTNKQIRLECIPLGIFDVLELSSVEDYRIFIPDGLNETFTAKEYYKAIKSRSRYDYYCLKLLMKLGLIERVGKNKNAYIYKVT